MMLVLVMLFVMLLMHRMPFVCRMTLRFAAMNQFVMLHRMVRRSVAMHARIRMHINTPVRPIAIPPRVIYENRMRTPDNP